MPTDSAGSVALTVRGAEPATNVRGRDPVFTATSTIRPAGFSNATFTGPPAGVDDSSRTAPRGMCRMNCPYMK